MLIQENVGLIGFLFLHGFREQRPTGSWRPTSLIPPGSGARAFSETKKINISWEIGNGFLVRSSSASLKNVPKPPFNPPVTNFHNPEPQLKWCLKGKWVSYALCHHLPSP